MLAAQQAVVLGAPPAPGPLAAGSRARGPRGRAGQPQAQAPGARASAATPARPGSPSAAELLGLLLPAPAPGSAAEQAPEALAVAVLQARPTARSEDARRTAPPSRPTRPEPLEDRALQPRAAAQKGVPAAATAEEDSVSTTDDSEASDEDPPSETTSPVSVAAGVISQTSARAARRVHFDEEAHEVFEVTPYREIYGMHPRLFDFDKDYSLVPAKGSPTPSEILARAADLEEDDEYESADEWGDAAEWDEVWTLSTTPLGDSEADPEDAPAWARTAREHPGEEDAGAAGGAC